MTARRTRRYASTRYIHPTIHRFEVEPMDGRGRYSIRPPNVSDLSAHVVHFNSADYRLRLRLNAIPVLVHQELLRGGLGIPGLGEDLFHRLGVGVSLVAADDLAG